MPGPFFTAILIVAIIASSLLRAGGRVFAASDLPPEGTRSLFDHLVKDNGGLPYPFEKILDLLARYDAEGKRPAGVLIPDGRSLLRAQASFEKPRVVVAASVRPADSESDLGIIFKGRLFLGFVEDAREIEVISYNDEAGRFEFQLVKDYYQGGAPRITYAPRSLCASCHQNEAPIFPVRPWDETNAEPRIASRILEARHIVASEAPKAEYFGIPVVNRLEKAETVDDLANLGNVLPTAQKIWIDGCGRDAVKGLECRRLLLRLALRYLWAPTEFPTQDAGAQRLTALQAELWPREGIPLHDPSLANRAPLAEEDSSSGVIGRITGLFQGSRKAPKEAPKSLAELGKLPAIRPELDPLRRRAPRKILRGDSLDGVYDLALFFSAADRRLLEKHSHFDFSRIDQAARSERLAPLFAPKPFRRGAFMKALLTELGVRRPPASFGESTEGMSPPIAEGAKPLRLSEGSVLKEFERYCFACHRGNPAARLDFMSGETEGEVLGRLKKVSEIREVLDYERYLGTAKEDRLMPPKNSYQRTELDRARAAGKDDSKKMADVIPGMFE